MGLFSKRDKAVAADRDAADGSRTSPADTRTTRVAAPGAYEVRPSMGSLSLRIALTVAGAVAMIVSALSTWFAGGVDRTGTELTYRVLSPVGSLGDTKTEIFTSVGAVVLALAALALLGLAFSTGWLTRLAGALGIVAVVMFGVRLFRAADADLFSLMGIGAWLLLLGGVLALIGGFMGTARRVVVDREREVVTSDRPADRVD
jgi:hypothetical protein